jgi:hypothetical protein
VQLAVALARAAQDTWGVQVVTVVSDVDLQVPGFPIECMEHGVPWLPLIAEAAAFGVAGVWCKQWPCASPAVLFC